MVEPPNDARFDDLIAMASDDHGVKNLLIEMFKIDLQKKIEDIIDEEDRYKVDVLRGQAGILRWYIDKLGG